MQRRLSPTSSFLAAAAAAVVAVAAAVAVFLPESRAETPAHAPAGAVAAAAPQAPATDQAPQHANPKAKPLSRSRRMWGANYFPNVPVIDQNGRTLKFYDDVIKDKIVVISFIYTACTDVCPLTTARLAQLADKLGDAVGRDIFFVSMSVDPERDTPERLKAFADAYDAGPGWLFLTGKLADIRAINYKLGDRSDRSLNDHRNEILMGNDALGDWQRDSVFGEIDRLVITLRQMNPKWLNEVQAPRREPEKPVSVIIPDHPGEALFTKICAPCHSIGHGDRVGPDLRDVTARRDRTWLKEFIESPRKKFAANDPTAMALVARFPGVRMPALGVGDVDVEDLLKYLDTESARVAGKPGAAAQANQQHP